MVFVFEKRYYICINKCGYPNDVMVIEKDKREGVSQDQFCG
jgi:hypothetical protein